MRWIINNKLRLHSDSKYRIQWDKPAPSKGAQAVKDFARIYASQYIWYEEYRLPGCLLRVDFLCANKKLAIEFNGKQHNSYVGFFAQSRAGFLKQIKNDCLKRKLLERNNYTLIEIEDSDLPLTCEWFEKKHGIFWI